MVKTLPSDAEGVGLIPGWGAEIPHALGPKNQNIKQKQYCNKFNKNFKNGPHQQNLKKKERSFRGSDKRRGNHCEICPESSGQMLTLQGKDFHQNPREREKN